jgi:hypothetical protein
MPPAAVRECSVGRNGSPIRTKECARCKGGHGFELLQDLVIDQVMLSEYRATMNDAARSWRMRVGKTFSDTDDRFLLARNGYWLEYQAFRSVSRGAKFAFMGAEDEPLFNTSTFSPDSASDMLCRPRKHCAHKFQRQLRTSGRSSPCSLI